MGLDGFEPPAPDERLRFSEADRPDAFRRPDAEERPPAMGLEGFEPPAKDSLVGPDTLERSATLAELMMSTPGKRPAAPPRGTRSLRRLQHANSLRREKSKKLTGELAKAIFSPEKPQKPMREDLQLVWQDVFDYEGAPHPARWQFQCEANDWVHDAQHGERQWYTDSVRNCHVRNGKLRIIARRERSNSCKYTSARLRTKYRGDWLYGRVEVRARLPPSKRGLWPAIWLLPTDEVYGGWPHSGEIDVMEHVGWEKNGLIHSACHSTRHNPTVGRQRSKAKLIPTAHRKFHVYAVDWQPTRISIFVDNELVLKVDDKGFGSQSWPYDQRFHLLLNLAVGGWGGMKGIDDRAFPACFEVDSVRVFQKRGGR
jgi:beta-glucanase (GH16 family)